MSTTAKFHTLIPMRDAVKHASNNIDTDYPAENCIDLNRNTTCRGSSTAVMRIDVDLGSAKAVDGVFIDVRNYLLADPAGTDRHWSDDGSSWTFISGSPTWKDNTQPLWLSEFTQVTHRYWRLTINVASAVNTDIGGLYWTRVRELSNRHEFPEGGGMIGLLTEKKGRGGDVHITVARRNPIRKYQRTYFMQSLTEFQILENVYKESGGIGQPFVLVDGDEDPIMLRWESPFSWSQIDHEVYEATCNFIEVPYYESGEIY